MNQPKVRNAHTKINRPMTTALNMQNYIIAHLDRAQLEAEKSF